jgi:hypothetical protein
VKTSVSIETGAGRYAGDSAAEAVDRFCRTCVLFYETRIRFLPGEAPGLRPPACYFKEVSRTPGWCGGTQYREGMP